MSALEDAIRDAANGGRLSGLTLWPSAGYGWQGNVRRAGSDGWTIEADADPVEALLKALKASAGYTAPAPKAEEPVLRGGLFD